MRKITLSLAVGLAALPGIAAAAEPPCLTAREFTALSSYALPSLITGTAQRCAPNLPADAFLKRGAGPLAARYAAARPAAWPGAKAAFVKLSGGMNSQASELFKALPDDKLRPLVDGLVEGLIAEQIPVNRCRVIDSAVRLLAPLPAANTAELIAIAVGLGSRSGGGRLGKIAICAA